MKKNRNNIGKSLGALLLLMAFSFVFTSCSDDDSAGGQPTITGVRVPDPAKADSLFTKSGGRTAHCHHRYQSGSCTESVHQ